MQRKTWVTIACTLFVFALDRSAKWFSYARWSSEPVTVAPNVQLTFLLNPGIAFSLPVGGILALLFTILLLLGFCVWMLLRLRRHQSILFLVFIIVGAFSNILDRVFYAGVVDYLRIVFPSVFNLADVMVLVGLVGLVLEGKEKKESFHDETN